MAAEKKKKSGRKPAFGTLVDIPPIDPPSLSKAAEVRAYKSLRGLLLDSPWCTASSTEAIEQAARLKARIERLRVEIDKLESEVVANESGVYIHPLVKQLAAAEISYRVSLGALTLTPKSIATSRLPAGSKPTRVPAQEAPTAKGGGKPRGSRARVLKMMGLVGDAAPDAS